MEHTRWCPSSESLSFFRPIWKYHNSRSGLFIGAQKLRHFFARGGEINIDKPNHKPVIFTPTSPDAPWCWNIYLHLPPRSPSYVGKYSSTMDPMGSLLPPPVVYKPTNITGGGAAQRAPRCAEGLSTLQCRLGRGAQGRPHAAEDADVALELLPRPRLGSSWQVRAWDWSKNMWDKNIGNLMMNRKFDDMIWFLFNGLVLEGKN